MNPGDIVCTSEQVSLWRIPPPAPLDRLNEQVEVGTFRRQDVALVVAVLDRETILRIGTWGPALVLNTRGELGWVHVRPLQVVLTPAQEETT